MAANGPPRAPAGDEACDVAYLPLGAAAYGGAERSLLELASAQRRAGLRVLVCHGPALGETDFVADARAQGLALRALDWSPESGLLAVAGGAARLFRSLDARVVHFNQSWRPHMWCVPVMARCFGGAARLVATMRALPEPVADLPPRRYLGLFSGPPLRSLLERLLGRVWAHCLHLTVSVNRDDYPPRLVDEYGFSAERLAVVRNGVRVAAEPPSAAERQRARRAIGLDDDGTFVVGFVGRLSAEKGVGYAIDALALCDRRAVLVIAGDGAEREALRQRADRLGLGDRVRFLGYLNDPLPLFTAADAVVVPSLWNEAFGRVVVEAMGCATPVIATAVGGMKEIFDDGVHGFLVPKADAAAIATAIDRWAGDRPDWQRMREAARELALSQYSTGRVAAEYGRLYERLGLPRAALAAAVH